MIDATTLALSLTLTEAHIVERGNALRYAKAGLPPSHPEIRAIQLQIDVAKHARDQLAAALSTHSSVAA
jgi:hypothetical protein